MRSDARIAPVPGSHLSDDQLIEAYIVDGLHSGDRHLEACRTCRARFEELARALQHVREDALRDADLHFTADRLHDQRDRILRRIERHGHPGEVVAFPQRAIGQPPSVYRMLGPARRWVAGAAAAGLAAGMFLGFAMDRHTHQLAATAALAQSEAVARQAAVNAVSDDQFFKEVEQALIGSRVREMRPDLGAIDVMTTPLEIREVSYVRE